MSKRQCCGYRSAVGPEEGAKDGVDGVDGKDGVDGTNGVDGAPGPEGTAWGFYSDDPASVDQVFLEGITARLLNDAAVSITTQLPTSNHNFYDGTTILPEVLGDSYLIEIRINAENDDKDGSFSLQLNIDSGAIIIPLGTQTFPKGANVAHDFSKTTSVFVGSTFLAEGGVVELTSVKKKTTVHECAFLINRIHLGR